MKKIDTSGINEGSLVNVKVIPDSWDYFQEYNDYDLKCLETEKGIVNLLSISEGIEVVLPNKENFSIRDYGKFMNLKKYLSSRNLLYSANENEIIFHRKFMFVKPLEEGQEGYNYFLNQLNKKGCLEIGDKK